MLKFMQPIAINDINTDIKFCLIILN